MSSRMELPEQQPSKGKAIYSDIVGSANMDVKNIHTTVDSTVFI